MTPSLNDIWERLPEKVRRRISRSERCWLWTGNTSATRAGYGTLHLGCGRLLKAHRLVYQLAFSVQLTPKQLVCHHCDTPATFADPFTALVEAEAWYVANVEKTT